MDIIIDSTPMDGWNSDRVMEDYDRNPSLTKKLKSLVQVHKKAAANAMDNSAYLNSINVGKLEKARALAENKRKEEERNEAKLLAKRKLDGKIRLAKQVKEKQKQVLADADLLDRTIKDAGLRVANDSLPFEIYNKKSKRSVLRSDKEACEEKLRKDKYLYIDNTESGIKCEVKGCDNKYIEQAIHWSSDRKCHYCCEKQCLSASDTCVLCNPPVDSPSTYKKLHDAYISRTRKIIPRDRKRTSKHQKTSRNNNKKIRAESLPSTPEQVAMKQPKTNVTRLFSSLTAPDSEVECDDDVVTYQDVIHTPVQTIHIVEDDEDRVSALDIKVTISTPVYESVPPTEAQLLSIAAAEQPSMCTPTYESSGAFPITQLDEAEAEMELANFIAPDYDGPIPETPQELIHVVPPPSMPTTVVKPLPRLPREIWRMVATYYSTWVFKQRVLAQLKSGLAVERFPGKGDPITHFPFPERAMDKIRLSRPPRQLADIFITAFDYPPEHNLWLWYYSIRTIDEELKISW